MHISVWFAGTNTDPVVPLPKTSVSLVIDTLTENPIFSTVNKTTVPIGNATLAFAGIVYVLKFASDAG
jgi:hypothetical protein